VGPSYGATRGRGAGDTSAMRLVATASLPAAFIAGVLLVGCGGSSDSSQQDKDKAIDAARFIYAGKATEDLSAGPCLSEGIPGLSDWVVDIAHDPRQAVDEESVNQCRSYRDGGTHHFVELTPAGQLIRAE
jgi:hypothetical protein